MSVAVLVPVLNEEAFVDRCLNGLFAQDYKGPLQFIFIDGGSTDDTVTRLKEHAAQDPRIVIEHNAKRVTPAALNVGLAAATSQYIARFDAHTTYPSSYISAGIARLERGDVASASGPQLAEGIDPWSRRIANALSTPLGIGGAGFRRPIEEEIEVDTGFTGLWKRETLVDLGGWDEDTYPNEDAELAARIRAEGGRIVCIPDMLAYYHPRASIRSLALQYWRYGQFRTRTAVRHPESLRRSHVLVPGLAITTVVAALPIPIISRIARGGLGIYGVAVVGSAAKRIRRDGIVDAAALPVIYTTIHMSWGFGFLRNHEIRFPGPGPSIRSKRK